MHTAVILPHRFRGDNGVLAWTLEGYAQQQLTIGHTVEVRVGCDGPGDQIEMPFIGRDGISCFFHRYSRIGAAAVRNRLVRETSSKTNLLVIGNADARPLPDMVQRHADTMKDLPPRSLVLGSAPWEQPAAPTLFDALITETPMIFSYCRMQPKSWYDFRCAWTINLSVRRQEFMDFGGFLDELRPVFYEDLAFAYRFLGGRKGVWYEPSAAVVHRHPMTLEQYLDREEMLGLMAPVFLRVYPEAANALFGTLNSKIQIDGLRAWVQLDHAVHRETLRNLTGWAVRSQDALGPERQSMAQTLYLLHLPIKRLAFRLGFLKGMELADDLHWEKRQPQGLWKQLLG